MRVRLHLKNQMQRTDNRRGAPVRYVRIPEGRNFNPVHLGFLPSAPNNVNYSVDMVRQDSKFREFRWVETLLQLNPLLEGEFAKCI